MTAIYHVLVVDSLYPGGLTSPDWQLLWVQNVLLMFVQLSTGATLYSQDERYARWLTAPLARVTSSSGRRLALTIHAIGGVTLVLVNVAFMYRWVADQSVGLTALVVSRPVLAGMTLAITGGFVLMAVLGVSLYAELTPGTRLPVWRFGYARSRKLHRGAFAVVVALLGYHVFLTPRVTVVWTTWIADREPFGVLTLALVAIWGVLAGHSLLMLGEWVTGDTYTRWAVDRTGLAAGVVALLVVVLAVERALLDGSFPLVTGSLLVVLLVGRYLVGRLGAERYVQL